MPRLSKLSRSTTIQDSSITPLALLDVFAPSLLETNSRAQRCIHRQTNDRRYLSSRANVGFESLFYGALTEASLCNQHKPLASDRHRLFSSSNQRSTRRTRKENISDRSQPKREIAENGSVHLRSTVHRHQNQLSEEVAFVIEKTIHSTTKYNSTKSNAKENFDRTMLWDAPNQGDERADFSDEVIDTQHATARTQHGEILKGPSIRHSRANIKSTCNVPESSSPAKSYFRDWTGVERTSSLNLQAAAAHDHFKTFSSNKTIPFLGSKTTRGYHTQVETPRSSQKRFADGSNLPSDFFNDVSSLKRRFSMAEKRMQQTQQYSLSTKRKDPSAKKASSSFRPFADVQDEPEPSIDEQLKLMQSIRELEQKLEKTRRDLAKSMVLKQEDLKMDLAAETVHARVPVVLTKEDYKNLVDLYYYSHNSRFSPESTDGSPTPIVLNDYSFTLSSDFSPGSNVTGKATESVNEDETYESPLEKIAEMLRQRQLREIAVMQVFIDLLLDDQSSNRALYEAYKQLPEPGVAYLPKGTLRLFLQRMSVPWTLSEKSMLRYLSLIDDMQAAKLPITTSEWSSAIYLAGRAFSKVDSQEVNSSFNIWQTMEREAGVQASNVTFNILFDIAVRSGRFNLGETVLKEMHSRNLRLNRLGRVSLMYYHGLRKDGDAVRKAYRDFVEAGEIVDTVVMNCVIASLLNAQEPQAAEQTYARMKDMQLRIRNGFEREGDETLYKRYPDPGSNTIGEDMASNRLGRILRRAPHLQQVLPEQHKQLQASMPLTPDHTTFRCMIAYHATTSGDLDRIAVLMHEMTDFFHLPLHTVFFQLLFKGFAIHGPTGGPQTTWSSKRLDLCWDACREAIKASNVQVSKLAHQKTLPNEETGPANNNTRVDHTLPSITQVHAIPHHSRLPDSNLPLSRPPPRRLSAWSEFVLDLAAFPRERLKRLERFHATMFDDEDMNKPHEKPGAHTFTDPFFQSVAYTAPEPQLDTEEGEYELPNPSESGLLYKTDAEEDAPPQTPIRDEVKDKSHQVVATKPLVCWLIRAYARKTKSRAKVEEVWGQIRKVYKPRDAMERESVVRVLRRCLRDCDREGGG